MTGSKTWARAIARTVIALGAGILAGTAAQAQDVPQVISPLKVETDHNGVNIVTGRMQMSPPVLSVPGAPNLRFDRVQNAAPYVRGTQSGGAGETVQGSFSVHTGAGSSESFQCLDFDCTGVTGTGSTFMGNSAYTFRQAGSGAVWSFSLKHVRTTGTNPVSILYYASQVSYPNGEAITYAYDTASLADDPYNRTFYRPNRVTSNLGYFITITYQPGELGTQGWNSPAEVTLYASADPATPLQRLTYSGNTITDLGGRVYTCDGCNNSLGSDLEVWSGASTLPGEASPTLQATAVSGVSGVGSVVASVARDGVQWNYAYTNLRYDATSNGYFYDRVTVTGPNSYNMVYEINDGRPNVITRITDPIGRATNYTFDAAFRPTLAIFPEGNQVSVVYDGYGNIVSRTATPKPNSGLAAITETAFYDETNCTGVMCYRPLWSRDGLNRQTDYVYNASGQLTEQTDPAKASGVRRRTIHEYAVAANNVSRRTATRVCGVGTTCGTNAEVRTEYEYWGNTLLPTVERRRDLATGAVLETLFTYDSAGRLLSTDGPLTGTADASYNRYDAYGRKTWEIGPLGANGVRNARRFTYRDSDDKPVATEEGTVPSETSTTLTVLSRTDITYDSRRNPIREAVSSSGGTTYTLVQRTFQDSGRLECETQRMNPAAFGSLPASACSLGTEGGQGPDRITRNVYDAAGQLLQVQRAYGTSLLQNYATYTYSANGKRTSVTDANGNRADLRYDGHDRQNRWVFPSLTTDGLVNEADYEAYTYDAVGNRLSLRKRDGVTITYQYDGRNQMSVKTVPTSASGAAGYSVFYGYDVARGVQLYARFGSASGAGITNAYDGFGRLTSSTNNMGGYSRTLSYQYDTGSRRSRLTFPDGNFFTYSYDSAGRLGTIWENGVSAIASFAYGEWGLPSQSSLPGSQTGLYYDAIGRLNGLIHDIGGTAHDIRFDYGHNAASQIVSRTLHNDAYASNTAYDVTRSYSVNGLNQYTAAGPATFAYDANGNLRWDGSTSFVYDAENRLVSASGAQTAALSYDPLGRLFQTSGGTAGTTQFLYDGDELVAEYDGAGNLLRRYVHGLGVDDPVLWYEGAGLGVRRHLHADHQGSILAVTDASSNLIAANGYDSWGIPNATNQGRFQYTGQAWIPELGMYHYKARIYSPTLGRFLQTDPVGYEDQVNLYAYVGNDPINAIDSSGEATDPLDSRNSDPCLSRVGISAGCSGQTLLGRIELAQLRTTRAPSARPRVGNARMAPGGVRGQAAPGGHIRNRHVGQTPRQLQERIQREGLERASTFRSEAVANTTLARAIRESQPQINEWVESGSPFPITIRYNSRNPLGTVLHRGQSTPQNAYTATFVLRPIPDNVWLARQYDYYIHTGFVE